MQQWFPVGASTYSGDLDGLFIMITIIVGVWFLVAEAVLFYLMFRYRRKAGRPAGYVKGDRKNQMAWVLVPCVAILGFDLYIDAASSRVWEHVKQTDPAAAITIRIDARQWAWDFTNPGPDNLLDTPDDIKSVNEVHVPSGVVVRFELRSMDTLHSFWVPELRLKQDAVPGRKFIGWFEPSRPGQYPVLCAELCGVAHGVMKGTMTVHPIEEYQRWVDSQAAAAASAQPAPAAPAQPAPATPGQPAPAAAGSHEGSTGS
jgi:cytochrome c oxidase subunit 2